MIWYLEQALGLAVLVLIAIAVLWELDHLVWWFGQILAGDAAYVLRKHAYDYIGWIFGTHFGWELG